MDSGADDAALEGRVAVLFGGSLAAFVISSMGFLVLLVLGMSTAATIMFWVFTIAAGLLFISLTLMLVVKCYRGTSGEARAYCGIQFWEACGVLRNRRRGSNADNARTVKTSCQGRGALLLKNTKKPPENTAGAEKLTGTGTGKAEDSQGEGEGGIWEVQEEKSTFKIGYLSFDVLRVRRTKLVGRALANVTTSEVTPLSSAHPQHKKAATGKESDNGVEEPKIQHNKVNKATLLPSFVPRQVQIEAVPLRQGHEVTGQHSTAPELATDNAEVLEAADTEEEGEGSEKSYVVVDEARAVEGHSEAAKTNPFDFQKREGYLSWHDYFMAVAFLSAQRSKDPSRQVGACIVGQDNVILGIGYNGFPRGIQDDDLPWAKASADGDPLKTKYPYVCHAEVNAILNRNHASAPGQRIYVTLFPCNECAKLIIQAGICEVVFFNKGVGSSSNASKAHSFAASEKLLGMANVKVWQHTPASRSLLLDFK